MKFVHLTGSLTLLLGLALLVGQANSAETKKAKKNEKKEDDPAAAAAKYTNPGPAHKKLNVLIGKWKATVKMYQDPTKEPAVMTGTMTRKWIMGKRFVQESFVGDSKEMPFKGMGLVGYDAFKKKYTAIWVDSMSTGITSFLGTHDSANKSITFAGETFDPQLGMEIKVKDVLTLVSKDKVEQSMYKEIKGKEVKVMEITYERVKKTK